MVLFLLNCPCLWSHSIKPRAFTVDCIVRSGHPTASLPASPRIFPLFLTLPPATVVLVPLLFLGHPDMLLSLDWCPVFSLPGMLFLLRTAWFTLRSALDMTLSYLDFPQPSYLKLHCSYTPYLPFSFIFLFGTYYQMIDISFVLLMLCLSWWNISSGTSRNFCLLSSLLNLQALEERLIHRRHLINICMLNIGINKIWINILKFV